jgi:hypothetical protein
MSAAPESSAGPLAGPSGHHEEEQGENDGVISPSTPVQPSNQVSQYFIKYLYTFNKYY